jgi:DNA-binding phage protein
MDPYVVTLRQAWRQSGLTMSQLAARSGLAENTVVAILGGRNAHFSSVCAVCQTLGIRSISLPATTSCGQ